VRPARGSVFVLRGADPTGARKSTKRTACSTTGRRDATASEALRTAHRRVPAWEERITMPRRERRPAMDAGRFRFTVGKLDMYTHTEVTPSYQYSPGSRLQRAPTSHGHRLAQVPDAHHADILVLPKQNGTARRHRLLRLAASGCVFLAGRAEAGRGGWPGAFQPRARGIAWPPADRTAATAAVGAEETDITQHCNRPRVLSPACERPHPSRGGRQLPAP
jgi:hypothetical protein